VRVLATFPELLDPSAPGPVGGEAALQPASPPVAEPSLSVASRWAAARPRRLVRRSRFPTGSIVALAVVAAAVWTLVAVREYAAPDSRRPELRLAAEPAGSAAAEATR
jgi:hypothetical protein